MRLLIASMKKKHGNQLSNNTKESSVNWSMENLWSQNGSSKQITPKSRARSYIGKRKKINWKIHNSMLPDTPKKSLNISQNSFDYLKHKWMLWAHGDNGLETPWYSLAALSNYTDMRRGNNLPSNDKY